MIVAAAVADVTTKRPGSQTKNGDELVEKLSTSIAFRRL